MYYLKREQETENRNQGTGCREQETENRKQRSGNREHERVHRNREKETENGEQRTENKERETMNGERRTGNGEQGEVDHRIYVCGPRHLNFIVYYCRKRLKLTPQKQLTRQLVYTEKHISNFNLFNLQILPVMKTEKTEIRLTPTSRRRNL